MSDSIEAKFKEIDLKQKSLGCEHLYRSFVEKNCSYAEGNRIIRDGFSIKNKIFAFVLLLWSPNVDKIYFSSLRDRFHTGRQCMPSFMFNFTRTKILCHCAPRAHFCCSGMRITVALR